MFKTLQSFLSTEEESPVSQQGATSSSSTDHFYEDWLEDQNKNVPDISERLPKIVTNIQCESPRSKPIQSQTHTVHDSSPTKDQQIFSEPSPVSQEKSIIPIKVTLGQSIGTLSAASAQSHDEPVTVSGRIEEISDEEIKNNRETEEGIRNIPRFNNYQRGTPSHVSVDNSNITALELLLNVYKRNNAFV